MASNKALERGTPLQLPVPAALKANAPVVFGRTYGASVAEGNFMCGVLNMDATDAFGNVQGFVSFDREGAFNLAVEGEGGSPLVGHGLLPGEAVYADINGPGSSYDAATNCWSGFALNANAAGVHFGYVLDTVVLGAGTTTVRVVLK
jgi:hypothetical protein